MEEYTFTIKKYEDCVGMIVNGEMVTPEKIQRITEASKRLKVVIAIPNYGGRYIAKTGWELANDVDFGGKRYAIEAKMLKFLKEFLYGT